MRLTDKVTALIKDNEHFSAYQIAKDTGISQPNITNLRNNKRKIKNIALNTAEKLGEFWDGEHRFEDKLYGNTYYNDDERQLLIKVLNSANRKIKVEFVKFHQYYDEDIGLVWFDGKIDGQQYLFRTDLEAFSTSIYVGENVKWFDVNIKNTREFWNIWGEPLDDVIEESRLKR